MKYISGCMYLSCTHTDLASTNTKPNSSFELLAISPPHSTLFYRTGDSALALFYSHGFVGNDLVS